MAIIKPALMTMMMMVMIVMMMMGAVDGEHLEAGVGEVALAKVDRPQPRPATPRQLLDRGVADVRAAADVEVAQLVAVPRDRGHADVCDPMAFCGGEVAEGGAEPGQLQQGGVGDGGAVRD